MPTDKRKQQAQQLHQLGQLDEALRAYLALTQADPAQVEAWQKAAMIYVQLGELSAAAQLLTQALKSLPNEASLYNSLGNVYSRQREYHAAQAAYEQALTIQPAYPGALTNLGNCHFQQQQWAAAETAYTQALQIDPDYPDAHFNLARLLVQQHELSRAEQHLRTTLTIIPHHAAAMGQLAELYLQQDNYDAAFPLLQQRVHIQPQHASSWQRLGATQLKRQNPAAAVDAYQMALTLDPNLTDIHYELATAYLAQGAQDLALQHYLRQLEQNEHLDSLYNVGVILTNRQRDTDAIAYFQQLLNKDPNYRAAHLNLAAIYLKQQQIDHAIMHYECALKLSSGDAEIQHILHALKADKVPSTAPSAYAEHLFDQYAPIYDQHLTQQLQYQAPHSLFDRVVSALYPEPHSLKILDLGCGTGLAGVLFAPYAHRLIGVDLSANMIEVAQRKHIYHELIIGPLQTTLKKQHELDLIIAADVFPYLGDLSDIFQLAFAALRPGGLLAFTTEKTSGNTYILQTSVRYAHSVTYLVDLAQATGFTVHDQASIVLRQQYKQPVEGSLFILRKP